MMSGSSRAASEVDGRSWSWSWETISEVFTRLASRKGIVTAQARSSSRSRKVWYVRRAGYAVVGPMTIGLLKRGLRAGRIPPDSEVRHRDWPYWRPLWAFEEALRAREWRAHAAA